MGILFLRAVWDWYYLRMRNEETPQRKLFDIQDVYNRISCVVYSFVIIRASHVKENAEKLPVSRHGYGNFHLATYHE